MDLGCGDGFYCEPLLRYVSELYCVDANEANVELVKSKFGGRLRQ